MQFRRATLDDVPAVVALIESAYRGDASRAGWTTEADLVGGNRTDPDEIRGILAQPANAIVLAERDGAFAACARIAIEDGAGYFGMFSVAPDAQRGGLGSAVLAECERIVRDEWHVPTMRMQVIHLRAELIAYYERRGYARSGEHRPFPYADPRVVTKRDDLWFEVLEKTL